MTKYTPKEIKDNVNIRATSPVKEFFELVIKILGVLLAVYILLGLLVDYIAPRISIDMERKLGRLFSAEFKGRPYSNREEKLQLVLDDLTKHAESLPKFNYKVYVKDSQDLNALALPGGNIVVFSALLKEVGSQNELAMVLAHELGHFAHRDHLRGLGRSLVFLTLSSFLLGTDSSVSKFIANTITNAEMRFSQIQEKAADIYALDLLHKTYGNVAGASDFFKKLAAKEKIGWFFYIFASHPYPQARAAAIKEEIKAKGYHLGQKIPLGDLGK